MQFPECFRCHSSQRVIIGSLLESSYLIFKLTVPYGISRTAVVVFVMLTMLYSSPFTVTEH